ncbi:MAG: OmpA family protein, partial [Flavobacteriales bacterium]|nr:OmpA family protein [Flavobacteriales bacterium]
ANPQVIIRLEGHTDNVGSHAYNVTLSQSRADVVKEALVQRGVAANRLMSEGFAENQPLESNETADGRSKNRRTEIFILSTANGR